MASDPVIICGAGLAGLTAARELEAQNIPVLVLEKSDGVGGRVRTDRERGFLFDRGFQVLLSAYPTARELLDFGALGLRAFHPGSMVRVGDRFHRLTDPWRKPGSFVQSLLTRVGTLADKTRLARLRQRVARGTIEEVFTRDQQSSLEYLRQFGFSERFIQHFFRPFFGGVFLESELETSSRMLEFTFRMFSKGDAVLPERGMQAIPDQLAAGLSADAIRLRTAVASVDGKGVTLESGERIAGVATLVATEAKAASILLQKPAPPRGTGTTCLYFATDQPPSSLPILYLNGNGEGQINNLAIPSNVHSSYAPRGRALVAASVLGSPDVTDEVLAYQVRQELKEWFGAEASAWEYLRTYRIPDSLPSQAVKTIPALGRSGHVEPGVYVCGDHREMASIEGAMRSGRQVADEIATKLRGGF